MKPLLRKYQIAFAALQEIATKQTRCHEETARDAMQRCIDIAEDEANSRLDRAARDAAHRAAGRITNQDP